MTAQTLPTYSLEDVRAIFASDTPPVLPDLTLEQIQSDIFQTEEVSPLELCNLHQALPLSFDPQSETVTYAISPESSLLLFEHPSFGSDNFNFVLASAQSIRKLLDTFPKTYLYFGEESFCTNWKIGNILLEFGFLGKSDLDFALNVQAKYPSFHSDYKRLGRILIEMNLITENALARALAEQHQIPYQDITDIFISPETLTQLEPELCLRFRVVPVVYDPSDKLLIVATTDPTNLVAIQAIYAAHAKGCVQFILTDEDSMNKVLEKFFSFDLPTEKDTMLLLPKGIPSGIVLQPEKFTQYSGGVYSAEPLSEFHQAALQHAGINFYLVSHAHLSNLIRNHRFKTRIFNSDELR